jgi:hypothetical protein
MPNSLLGSVFVIFQLLNITLLDVDLKLHEDCNFVDDTIEFFNYPLGSAPWLAINNCSYDPSGPHSFYSNVSQNFFRFWMRPTDQNNRGFKLLVEHVPDPTYWIGRSLTP